VVPVAVALFRIAGTGTTTTTKLHDAEDLTDVDDFSIWKGNRNSEADQKIQTFSPNHSFTDRRNDQPPPRV
jgi:hypothetical protein